MKKVLAFVLNFIFKYCKIQKKIVFETGRGLIDGNPRAVYEYMVENCPKEFKLIWLVEKDTNVSMLRKGDFVYYRTLKSYYHLATARYWIRSQSLGNLIKKKKGQTYIQLWHGNGAMKLMGYDSNNAKERPTLEHVKEWDYYIANDELDAQHIITSTGYNKKYDILGMASFDSTLKLSKQAEFKKEVLNKLGVSKELEDKKIILYAPTFRDFDLEKEIVNVPIEKLSGLEDSIVLVRLHPWVKDKVNHELFKSKNLINACEYPDASDLLAICDILITDYSSIFYQYSPLERPILFYPYDFEKYKELRGGFYLDYETELPGAVCYTEEELFNTLKNIDELKEKFMEKQQKFNQKYNYLADGNACKRFVRKLINGDFK